MKKVELVEHEVKDLGLAEQGAARIEWAGNSMPVLRLLRERFEEERPLEGVRISGCLHVTTETANLMLTLKAGGAELALCASNPLSTQDDVAAQLVRDHDIRVFAVRGEDSEAYYEHIRQALLHRPQVTMDDGADLVSAIHFLALNRLDQIPPTLRPWAETLSPEERKALAEGVIGSTEETTTGVIRLRSLADQGLLQFPVMAVNDSNTKHLFDNRYGTGQSTWDGILRATNRLVAGSTVVVCGYGWCGRGVAMRARGLGGKVIVTEVDPLKALEAVMDGYEVMPLADAAPRGDLFVTVTGDLHVIRREHFERMKDGAIVANAGHFDVEIDLEGLGVLTAERRVIRPFVTEHRLKDGRRIFVLAEGRLVNLVAAEGHPASVMDMSFANQALTARYLVQDGRGLERRVYRVPSEIDEEIAALKLEALGVKVDQLTSEQAEYLASWERGT